MKYDFLVFIGRFQPLHDGHVAVIQEALQKAKHVVILVGSANASRSFRNPFTYEERSAMIDSVFREEIANDSIIIAPIDDFPYNDQAWIAQVQATVCQIVLKFGNNETPSVHLHGMSDFKVGLIGFAKDGSSYYLKMFPTWGSENVEQEVIFNATDIRNNYFKSAPILPRDICPEPVVDFMRKFMRTNEFKRLTDEFRFVLDYREMWKVAPYPPTFNTVDAVVIQSGHVLLVNRGQAPGEGLLALPGGHLDPNETMTEAAIRELKEETRISDNRGEIPPGVLKSFIRAEQTFDHPHRDPRGRYITRAYLFEIPNSRKLYEVKGDSDAAKASWYPIGTLDPRNFFLDHFHILSEMMEKV